MVASIHPRGKTTRESSTHSHLHPRAQWMMMGTHQWEIHIIISRNDDHRPQTRPGQPRPQRPHRPTLPYPADESGLNRRTTSATAALALCVADLVRVCEAVVTKGGNEALVGRPPCVDCSCCCCCCCDEYALTGYVNPPPDGVAGTLGDMTCCCPCPPAVKPKSEVSSDPTCKAGVGACECPLVPIPPPPCPNPITCPDPCP